MVGAVSNCAVSTDHGIYAVRLKTAPTGRRKCPFIFRIHYKMRKSSLLGVTTLQVVGNEDLRSLKKNDQRYGSDPSGKFFSSDGHETELASRHPALGSETCLLILNAEVFRLGVEIVQRQPPTPVRCGVRSGAVEVETVVEHAVPRLSTPQASAWRSRDRR